MKSNEKLKETLQPLVDEIVAGLSEETLDYLYEHGHEELISFEELSKLFKETFGLNKEYPQTYFCQPYLKYNKRGKMELRAIHLKNAIWSAQCDLNDPKSIISSAIEWLNHCKRMDDIEWLPKNVRSHGDE